MTTNGSLSQSSSPGMVACQLKIRTGSDGMAHTYDTLKDAVQAHSQKTTAVTCSAALCLTVIRHLFTMTSLHMQNVTDNRQLLLSAKAIAVFSALAMLGMSRQSADHYCDKKGCTCGFVSVLTPPGCCCASNQPALTSLTHWSDT